MYYPFLHSTVYWVHVSGMQEWVLQIPSIPIFVSVLFLSLHFRKILLLVADKVEAVEKW